MTPFLTALLPEQPWTVTENVPMDIDHNKKETTTSFAKYGPCDDCGIPSERPIELAFHRQQSFALHMDFAGLPASVPLRELLQPVTPMNIQQPTPNTLLVDIACKPDQVSRVAFKVNGALTLFGMAVTPMNGSQLLFTQPSIHGKLEHLFTTRLGKPRDSLMDEVVGFDNFVIQAKQDVPNTLIMPVCHGDELVEFGILGTGRAAPLLSPSSLLQAYSTTTLPIHMPSHCAVAPNSYNEPAPDYAYDNIYASTSLLIGVARNGACMVKGQEDVVGLFRMRTDYVIPPSPDNPYIVEIKATTWAIPIFGCRRKLYLNVGGVVMVAHQHVVHVNCGWTRNQHGDNVWSLPLVSLVHPTLRCVRNYPGPPGQHSAQSLFSR